MSKSQRDAMKDHLAAALNIAIERERMRVDALLADIDENIQADIRAMRPIIEALIALAEQCRNVPGLSIDPAPAGHMALIHATDKWSRSDLCIRPTGSQGFSVEDSGSGPPEPYSLEECCSRPEEVVQKVIEFIARHVDAVGRHPPAEGNASSNDDLQSRLNSLRDK